MRYKFIQIMSGWLFYIFNCPPRQDCSYYKCAIFSTFWFIAWLNYLCSTENVAVYFHFKQEKHYMKNTNLNYMWGRHSKDSISSALNLLINISVIKGYVPLHIKLSRIWINKILYFKNIWFFPSYIVLLTHKLFLSSQFHVCVFLCYEW